MAETKWRCLACPFNRRLSPGGVRMEGSRKGDRKAGEATEGATSGSIPTDNLTFGPYASPPCSRPSPLLTPCAAAAEILPLAGVERFSLSPRDLRGSSGLSRCRDRRTFPNCPSKTLSCSCSRQVCAFLTHSFCGDYVRPLKRTNNN